MADSEWHKPKPTIKTPAHVPSESAEVIAFIEIRKAMAKARTSKIDFGVNPYALPPHDPSPR